MPFRQIIGAFVSTSLFFLGATAMTTNGDDRNSIQYSFSTHYNPELDDSSVPRYIPI